MIDSTVQSLDRFPLPTLDACNYYTISLSNDGNFNTTDAVQHERV
jgi:hypothetical protein